MKIKILTLLSFLGIFCNAQAPADTTSIRDKQTTYTFQLRKGLETKDDKDKPAVLSLTWPQDGKGNSYLINAAAGLNINRVYRKSSLDITPAIVYNRNNQIKKEQYNYKAALVAQILTGTENNAAHSYTRILIMPTVQHMWNRVDTSRSFFATLYGAVRWKSSHFTLNGMNDIGNSPFLFYIGIVPGFEYQDRYSVKTPNTKGHIFRFYWSTDLRLAIRWGATPATQFKHIEWTFNYAQRNQLSSTLPVDEKTTHFLRAGMDFFPLNSDAVSIGVSYNEGEDPIAAIDKQNF